MCRKWDSFYTDLQVIKLDTCRSALLTQDLPSLDLLPVELFQHFVSFIQRFISGWAGCAVLLFHPFAAALKNMES